MNRIYRLVWNRALGVLQVTSELARGRTKGGRSAYGGRCRAEWLAGVALSLPLGALAATPSTGITATGAAVTAASSAAANALPTGGTVTAGTGTITQGGSTLTVTQQSQNLSLNWQSFNIGRQSTVDFVQPDASAIAVNRIADTNGSQILGHLNANGQVFLINPNGVLFGQGAQVNVGGLVASTLNVADGSLGSDSLNFSGNGNGSVTNRGTLTAATGGYIVLLGNQVSNQGVIRAQLGSVALAGGSAVTLAFNGDQLLDMRVDQGTLNALAENRQLIVAPGGQVLMSASAANNLLASVVNNTGVIEAAGVSTAGGAVRLVASGGDAIDSGSITVSGVKGGSVQVLSDQDVSVTGTIDASGTQGGGSIRVGGGYQGGEGLQTATVTYVGANAKLDADATQSGNGGSVVVWGNQGNNFSGKISARGGATGGNGGLVETSAHNGLNADGHVDASAARGKAGTWLLDPYNVTIAAGGAAFSNPFTATATSTISPTIIGTALSGGTNVFVFTNTRTNGTDAGNITLNSPITASGGGSLYLEAVGSIFLNANINSDVAHPLNVNLWANYGGAAQGTTYASNAACAACQVVIGDVGNAAVSTFGGSINIETGNTSHVGGSFVIGNGSNIGSIDTSNGSTDGALTVNAAGITQSTTAGNSIVAGSATLNGGSGSINLANAGNTFGGAVTLTGNNISLLSSSNLTLGPISAGSVTIQTAAGTNLTLTGAITATDGGDALVLVSGGAFTNNAGSAALDAVTGAWLVWSQNPANDNRGGLTYAFKQYNASYGSSAVLGTGNGFLYTLAPTVTATLIGAVSKTYDGTTTATLGPANYAATGQIDGDTVIFNDPVSGNYDTAHAGTGKTVAVNGLAIASANNGSAIVYGYQLSGTTAQGNVGTITPAPLTISLSNVTDVNKTYDGTTAAPVGFSPTYSFVGLVAGDSATLSSSATPVFNSAHVASATAITQGGLSLTSITGNGTDNSVLGDYTLSSTTAATGVGVASISPIMLTATAPTIGGTLTKTYDGTTAAIGASLSGGSVSGALSGDSLTLDTSAITLAYNSSHVLSASSISANGNLAVNIGASTNGSLSTDYSFASPAISAVAGTITPATLTPTLTNSGVTKSFDGTTNAPAGFTPTYSFSGLVSGDTTASLSDTGAAYDSAHVAVATNVTVSGLSISGITGSNSSLASDYTLAIAAASVAANITPAPLTISLSNVTNVTKSYDGATAAPGGFSPTYSFIGLVAGDSATVSSSAIPLFNSAHVATATAITQGGLFLTSVSGNGSDNSVLSDYTLSSSNAATGAGVAGITPAVLTPTLTNSGVTKTYDGTTNAPAGFTPTYSFSGFAPGDTNASLTDTGAAYNSAHVASATGVTVSGLSVSGIIGSNGSLASDYTLAAGSASVAASITPAPLTIGLSNVANVTKTYDGNTAAPGSFSPLYSFIGLVAGDSATVSSAATPVYNSAHVATATVITQGGLFLTSITGNGTDNSVVGDYTLSSTNAATGAGVAGISPITLSATAPIIGGTLSKIYDGTTVATGATLSGGSVSGALSGDSLTLDTSAVTLAYNGSHVLSAGSIGANGSLAVNIGASTNGSLSTDYTVALPAISPVAANITAATLTPTLTNSGVTKSYDGTTNAPAGFTPTYSFSGLISGDTGAGLNDTAVAYNSARVASATRVTVSGLSISGITGSNGSLVSDYTLASASAGVAASITPATLTAGLTGMVSKVYDGTATATLAPGNYTLIGVVGSDAVSLNDPTSGIYAAANAGSGINVGVGGLAINGSAASNYVLANSTATAAIGTITPAPLSVTANNAGKTYDATAYSGGNGVIYSGFVNGEGASVLAGTLAYGGNSQGAINVGSYSLTPSGLSSGNYLITYSNGTLTVSPATLTYVATPAQVYAGQAVPPLTGTVTGFQGSDTLVSATTGMLAFTTPATTQSAAGKYAITGGGLAANDGDYVFVQAGDNVQGLTVLISGGEAWPGVAYLQQQLGQSQSSTSPDAVDLYTPDVRVIAGGVRLP